MAYTLNIVNLKVACQPILPAGRQVQHPGIKGSKCKVPAPPHQIFFTVGREKRKVKNAACNLKLFLQYNPECCSFSQLRMFYKQLPFMILFNDSFAKRKT